MLSQTPRHPSLHTDDDISRLKAAFDNEIFVIKECDLGIGIFAAKYIAMGDQILAFGGGFIDFTETKRRGEWECMPIQVGMDRYIDTTPPGVFVNHSCDPNAAIVNDRDLVAVRAIPEGQEIRFDYSTTMHERSFMMRCRCGSPQCRGVVRDFETLPPHLQERYRMNHFVMSFIEQLPAPAIGRVSHTDFSLR